MHIGDMLDMTRRRWGVGSLHLYIYIYNNRKTTLRLPLDSIFRGAYWW